MAHTTHDKQKLISRVRRIKGQLEGIEKALSTEIPCAEVLRQLASIRGAVNGLTAEVMEHHLLGHVVAEDNPQERFNAGLEMVKVINTYMK